MAIWLCLKPYLITGFSQHSNLIQVISSALESDQKSHQFGWVWSNIPFVLDCLIRDDFGLDLNLGSTSFRMANLWRD